MADLAEILTAGGERRITLLRYCVMSMNMEPMFVFLASEYRMRPTHAGALALYDVFCTQEAPARLDAYELLPPRELRIDATISRIRDQWRQMQLPEAPDPEAAIAIATPARDLFDVIVRGVREDARGRWAKVSATFDPQLTAQENLPGGKMNAGQRHFAEKVWHGIAKPQLVRAGFWQIATVG